MSNRKNPICGIYKITSPTGRIYIGQSRNIQHRKADYKCLHNCNEQRKLYNSFLKYGFLNHHFEVIHVCLPEELNPLEQQYITLFDSTDSKNGLNIRYGGLGRSLSPETRKRISIANTGKRPSEETRLKQSLAKKGKAPWNKGKTDLPKRGPRSEETRRKISLANRGRIFSDESRKKNSESKIGLIPWNKGLKGRQVAWNKGKNHSPKSCEKMRLSHLGVRLSEVTKKRMSLAQLGKRHTEEAKRNMSIAQKLRYKNLK